MAVLQLPTYCAMGASRCGVLTAVVDGRLQKVNPDPEHPNGCICVKGSAAPDIIYAPERLRYPMQRTTPIGDRDPSWVHISWDEALELATSRLLDIKARYGPEAVVFGRATPAASASADWEPWLVRLANAFGSPNRLSTTHICTWNKTWGSKYTYGVGIPSADYDNANGILLWGFNPQVSWPAAAMRINRARARGAKLIVIDPRKTSAADKADLWLRVRPGTDEKLARSMIHVLLEEGIYDRNFVREWTNGAFLVWDDTQRLLTARDLMLTAEADAYIAWDGSRGSPVEYHADRGYGRDGVEPSLSGTFAVTLAEGQTIACRPALAALAELVAQYAPERAEAITSVPALDVRRAVRWGSLQAECLGAFGARPLHGHTTLHGQRFGPRGPRQGVARPTGRQPDELTADGSLRSCPTLETKSPWRCGRNGDHRPHSQLRAILAPSCRRISK